MQEAHRERRKRKRLSNDVLSFRELEEVRLLLRGGSVIDWVRAHYDLKSAKAFLRLQEFRADEERDHLRMCAIKTSALSYLANIGEDMPKSIRDASVTELLVMASEAGEHRLDACKTLKAMHIVHHIDSRKLRYRLGVSEKKIAGLLAEKVHGFRDRLVGEKFPLVSFDGGEKQRTSEITKLLVKREHHAAQIHDRVRFRFIVEEESDLVPLLSRITRELLPFNYIVPDKSVNLLVNFSALMESHQSYRDAADKLQVNLGYEESRIHALNEFSGMSYRCINFVADVPIRVPLDLMNEDNRDLGFVIFALAEFQLFDRKTDIDNQKGENKHEAYKARQVDVVRERLALGINAKK